MALLILSDSIVEKYYEVTGRDSNNRPSSIIPFKKNEGGGFRFSGKDENLPNMPILFSTKDMDEKDAEMDYYSQEGWKLL